MSPSARRRRRRNLASRSRFALSLSLSLALALALALGYFLQLWRAPFEEAAYAAANLGSANPIPTFPLPTPQPTFPRFARNSVANSDGQQAFTWICAGPSRRLGVARRYVLRDRPVQATQPVRVNRTLVTGQQCRSYVRQPTRSGAQIYVQSPTWERQSCRQQFAAASASASDSNFRSPVDCYFRPLVGANSNSNSNLNANLNANATPQTGDRVVCCLMPSRISILL